MRKFPKNNESTAFTRKFLLFQYSISYSGRAAGLTDNNGRLRLHSKDKAVLFV